MKCVGSRGVFYYFTLLRSGQKKKTRGISNVKAFIRRSRNSSHTLEDKLVEIFKSGAEAVIFVVLSYLSDSLGKTYAANFTFRTRTRRAIESHQDYRIAEESYKSNLARRCIPRGAPRRKSYPIFESKTRCYT